MCCLSLSSLISACDYLGPKNPKRLNDITYEGLTHAETSYPLLESISKSDIKEAC